MDPSESIAASMRNEEAPEENEPLMTALVSRRQSILAFHS
jgi:hypothetical protein